ncbi:phosphotransferase [Bacillus sp. CGMCC 1.16607]|uniref:phosphotransferase n=1 Tax=Bacillus sp. CGMCC 1.16607 TaxID=3351842 RepID=UPI003629BE25
MNLQTLFYDPILSVQELSPGYDDHASDVWLVKTSKEEVVVRTSRMIEEPDNDFWWGCKSFFGIDPRKVWELEDVNNILKPISSIPVPSVIHKGKIEQRELVVVEKLEGTVLTSLIEQPESVLESLGKGLASIHQFQANYVGNPSGTFQVPLEKFHEHLMIGMEEHVSKFYQGTSIANKLPEMVEIIKQLPPIDYASFVLIDMDPTQFLTDSMEVTGIVDTEAYVLAPREFDFIGLEYLLDTRSAEAFKKGYESILPIPNLSEYRKPYRYLYRLLAVQGKVEIEKWLNHNIFF